jgi:hypothetical protein
MTLISAPKKPMMPVVASVDFSKTPSFLAVNSSSFVPAGHSSGTCFPSLTMSASSARKVNFSMGVINPVTVPLTISNVTTVGISIWTGPVGSSKTPTSFSLIRQSFPLVVVNMVPSGSPNECAPTRPSALHFSKSIVSMISVALRISPESLSFSHVMLAPAAVSVPEPLKEVNLTGNFPVEDSNFGSAAEAIVVAMALSAATAAMAAPIIASFRMCSVPLSCCLFVRGSAGAVPVGAPPGRRAPLGWRPGVGPLGPTMA